MTREEIATQVLVAAIRESGHDLTPKQIAQVAVAMADELLAELANTTPRRANMTAAIEALREAGLPI